MLAIGGLPRGHRYHLMILFSMTTVGIIHALQFFVYYFSAFFSGIKILDADILFNGFSNPRFFGQFQAMLIPVMAALIMRCRRTQLTGTATLLALALIGQWCIALTLGGRGLWLGLLASNFTLTLLSRQLRQILFVQTGTAFIGFMLYALLFWLIPFWFEIDLTLHSNLRTGLSGREIIWRSASEMVLAHPWFGVGPMHFAATYNAIAAHPHQAILQWAAEWGIAATLIALYLGARGLGHGARTLLQHTANELDAGLWIAIVGTLVLAQVDGVFVMPYTETWLALLSGVALARWSTPHPPSVTQRFACLIITLPIAIVLGKILISEAPALPQATNEYMTAHQTGWTPRFWLQGWIPMEN